MWPLVQHRRRAVQCRATGRRKRALLVAFALLVARSRESGVFFVWSGDERCRNERLVAEMTLSAEKMGRGVTASSGIYPLGTSRFLHDFEPNSLRKKSITSRPSRSQQPTHYEPETEQAGVQTKGSLFVTRKYYCRPSNQYELV
jgi:hypothetical protein